MKKRIRNTRKKRVTYKRGVIAYALIVSVIISAAAIFIGGDVFGISYEKTLSSDEPRKIVLDEGMTEREVASKLRDAGLIRFPRIFGLYAKIRGYAGKYIPGEYGLSAGLGYDELIYALNPGKGARTQIRITIPEGYTSDEIISMLTSLGIGTREGFVKAFAECAAKHGVPVSGEALTGHELEGYLFPDTYYVYSDSGETEIAEKLTANFRARFTPEMKKAAESLGMTENEAVILASIIQSEAYYDSDMAKISSVFRNRLRAGMRLESDATMAFADEAEGRVFSKESLDRESPYNTYLRKGLPPGAVCNPGLASLEAAVYPENTKYYYFFTGSDKKAVFSRTYSQHLSALAGSSGGKQ